jgi:hypothetical protein
VIKGFACPLNERGHRAGQLSQICMTRCASYRSSSRKADGQMNGKGRSFDWQRPSYNGGSSPSNSLQVHHVLRFCRLTTISLLFFDPVRLWSGPLRSRPCWSRILHPAMLARYEPDWTRYRTQNPCTTQTNTRGVLCPRLRQPPSRFTHHMTLDHQTRVSHILFDYNGIN